MQLKSNAHHKLNCSDFTDQMTLYLQQKNQLDKDRAVDVYASALKFDNPNEFSYWM